MVQKKRKKRKQQGKKTNEFWVRRSNNGELNNGEPNKGEPNQWRDHSSSMAQSNGAYQGHLVIYNGHLFVYALA